jgi:hypothetical protein
MRLKRLPGTLLEVSQWATGAMATQRMLDYLPIGFRRCGRTDVAYRRRSLVKSWPWRMILGGIGGLLILVGVTPIAYLLWFGNAHNFEPLSAPLSLKRGEYASALFKTDLDEDYQVEIYFLSGDRSPLELDWKIVDERGVLIQSGVYTEDQHSGGNDAILTRKYRPKRGSANRIILNVHQDVQVKSGEGQLQPTDVRLHIGVPERGLEQAYGSAAAIVWAAVVGGLGAILLVCLLVMRAIRPKPPGAGSNPQPASAQ